MPYRTPTRWLAPLALLAAVVAVFVVWSGSTGGDSDDDRSATTTSTTARGEQKSKTSTNTETTTDTTDTTATQTTPLNGQKSYTVRPGDTLAGIAAQTGVSVEQLQDLNPDLDPNSMSVGDKVKLVE